MKEVPSWLNRTYAKLKECPQVKVVKPPVKSSRSNIWSIEIQVRLNLPNSVLVQGSTDTGVKAIEDVRLDFDVNSPSEGPELSLRSDFPRDFPHLQPWTTPDDRPVPCVGTDPIQEQYRHFGILHIICNASDWLERAAENTLAIAGGVWEPTPRNYVTDFVVADLNNIRKRYVKPGQYKAFKFRYIRPHDSKELTGVLEEQFGLKNWKVFNQPIEENFDNQLGDLFVGDSVGFIACSDKMPDGPFPGFSTYPSTHLSTYDHLKDFADRVNCGRQLTTFMALLNRNQMQKTRHEVIYASFIFAIPRPYKISGTDSFFEMLAYVLVLERSQKRDRSFRITHVRPAQLRSQITPSILSEASGDTNPNFYSWQMIGVGSLGSKIALHMSRRGNAPTAIIDKGKFAPHNAARHASLPPLLTDTILPFLTQKVDIVNQDIARLNQSTRAIGSPVEALTDALSGYFFLKTDQPNILINSTASPMVREFLDLNLLSSSASPPRVVDACLFSRGRIALVALSGPECNPNIHDLLRMFFFIAAGQPNLKDKVFHADTDDLQRVSLGEGCDTVTMPMSDSWMSISAAAVSELLNNLTQSDELPELGKIFVGFTHQSEGLTPPSLNWESYEAPCFHVLNNQNCQSQSGEQWELRISDHAWRKIVDERDRYPNVETGGVIMGRVNEFTRSVRILDVLEAPEDSVRSANKFTLGTEKLSERILAYESAKNGAAVELGTWHSHLSASGASDTDLSTARKIVRDGLSPAAMLIVRPDCCIGYVADLPHDPEFNDAV